MIEVTCDLRSIDLPYMIQVYDVIEEMFDTAGRIGSEVMPGFWLNASWLWATPLPNRFICLEEILRGT